MKKILLSIVLLFSISTFAQNNIDKELLIQTPNCESVAYNSSRLIERYFEQKKYDSINVVSTKWEEFCGVTEPLFRIKVLHQIQSKTFSEEWMDKSYLLNFIFEYQDRLKYAKEKNPKQFYESYKVYFGYIPLNSTYDDLTVLWASALLENSDLQPLERAFCLLYSNQTDAFWQMLQDQQIADTKLQEVYNKQALKTKRMADANIGFLTGVMLPFGNFGDIVGVKAAFGFQFGMKMNKMQFDMSMLFRSGNTKQGYSVIYQGQPTMTNYYFGPYIGLDIAYELLRHKRNELDLLLGVGYDAIVSIEGDVDNNVDGLELGTANWNLGIGYRLYAKKRKNYLGFQAKYNFVNYLNPGGTDLSGDYVSLVVTANLFGNARKKSNMEKLHLN
jgi:hypothetical protein